MASNPVKKYISEVVTEAFASVGVATRNPEALICSVAFLAAPLTSDPFVIRTVVDAGTGGGTVVVSTVEVVPPAALVSEVVVVV